MSSYGLAALIPKTWGGLGLEQEVTVVGAGPAGCLLAIYLLRRGFSVNLFEKREATIAQPGIPLLFDFLLGLGGDCVCATLPLSCTYHQQLCLIYCGRIRNCKNHLRTNYECLWHGVREQGNCCAIHIHIPWCLHLVVPKLWKEQAWLCLRHFSTLFQGPVTTLQTELW